jgi:thermitase
VSASAAALARRVPAVALVVVAAWFGLGSAGSAVGRPALVPNDPFYAGTSYRWTFARPGFEKAWTQTLGDPSVVVAVVDTGVTETPDLRGALLPGYDAITGGTDASDLVGHGTEVAELIAARAANGIGIAGACARCSILPVRVTDDTGAAPPSAIAAGIVWAVDHAARIVNVSIAAPDPTPELEAAVRYAAGHGVLVVAAAGNDARAGVDYPAALAGVLSVEASTQDDQPYPFSNRGPSVSLAAPGCAVTGTREGSVTVACGTSVAAPLVSGAAALLASVHPTADASALADALEQGADRVGDTRFGRLDVARALAVFAPPARRRR